MRQPKRSACCSEGLLAGSDGVRDDLDGSLTGRGSSGAGRRPRDPHGGRGVAAHGGADRESAEAVRFTFVDPSTSRRVS